NNTKDDNTDGKPDPAGTFNGLNTVIRVANAGFVSPGPNNFDYHLQVNSPARDRATGSGATVDLDLNPRTGVPDLGAFEFTPPPAPGRDTPGVFDPSTGVWYLRNENAKGGPDAGQFAFGAPGWIPIVGDWDGNGTFTVGVF